MLTHFLDMTYRVNLDGMVSFLSMAGAVAATLWIFTLASLTVVLSMKATPEASPWFEQMARTVRKSQHEAKIVPPATAEAISILRSMSIGLWVTAKVAPVATLFQAAFMLCLVAIYPRPPLGALVFLPMVSTITLHPLIAKLMRRLQEFRALELPSSNRDPQQPKYDIPKLNFLAMLPRALVLLGGVSLFAYPAQSVLASLVCVYIVVALFYAGEVVADIATTRAAEESAHCRPAREILAIPPFNKSFRWQRIKAIPPRHALK